MSKIFLTETLSVLDLKQEKRVLKIVNKFVSLMGQFSFKYVGHYNTDAVNINDVCDFVTCHPYH